jgi:hypothetical protein
MKVGNKVICRDDYIQPHMREEISRDFQQWVTKGKVYTIREILENDGIVPGVLLEEIHNKPLYFAKTINRVQEPAFGIFRFDEYEVEELVGTRVKELDKIY